MLGESYSTREVTQRSGATARQLQWWDEHRLITPERNGRRRVYSSTDLADILVVLELRRRHISLHQVRRALRFLKKQLGARFADLVSSESIHPLRGYYLLIDGRRLYLETDSRQIFEILQNSEQAAFLISLSTAAHRLCLPGGTTPQRLHSSALSGAKKPVSPARSSHRRNEAAAS